jgi:D-alanyl-D-alanine carboxypeptidase
MVSGYFFSHDADNAPLAPLLGRDVKTDSVSWMQAAGGIVAPMNDVARWSRALYEGPLLAGKQRTELETIVSLKNGKRIAATSPQDPLGFGLGVGQGTRPGMGTYWYYEGMTLGYRVIYFYLPKSQAVVAVGLNSQPDAKENKVGELMSQIYKVLQGAGKL